MNILEHKINTLIVIATSFIVLSSPAEGRSHKSSEIITPIEPSSPYSYLGRFDIGKPSEISTMSLNTKTSGNSANGSGKVTPEINSKVENEEIQSALASLERAFNTRQSRDPSPDYNNNLPAPANVPHHHHPLVDHTHDHFHRHHHHSTEEHEHTR